MKKLRFLFWLIFLSVSTAYGQRTFDITDFGAVSGGKTLNTKAIQAAIDACHASGGGNVVIPNGTFLSGTIRLKDNVALYLEPSAELLGSPEFDDYEWVPYSRGRRRALVYADGQTNIAILGRGTLNGNGVHPNFFGKDPYNGIGGGQRPFLIYIDNCTRVQMRDFKTLNSAFWNLKVEFCKDVLIDGITVHNVVLANEDGIDIMDCDGVRVSNCHITAGDDAICLKSNTKIGLRNVVVTNCVISSMSNAIKFGVASVGGFENVAITNCALHDTRLSGIALEMVEGGKMERVTISNITMHNVNGSIFMKLGWKKGYEPAVFRNVILSNIIADGIGHWKADTTRSYYKKEYDPRIGITITGQAECVMENVILSNIRLQFAGGGTQADADRPFRDQRPRGYPEYHNFGVTPAYGINCQYVKNIRFDNIVLDYAADDVRPAMFFLESENVTLDGIHARVSDDAKAYVRFVNQNGALVTGSRPVSGKIPFCSLEGSSENVTLTGNDFSHTGAAFVKDGTVNAAGVREMYNVK